VNAPADAPRRRGRPAVGESPRISIRFPDDVYAALQARAEDTDDTVSAIVRGMVERQLALDA
jgi:hypothetical protein